MLAALVGGKANGHRIGLQQRRAVRANDRPGLTLRLPRRKARALPRARYPRAAGAQLRDRPPVNRTGRTEGQLPAPVVQQQDVVGQRQGCLQTVFDEDDRVPSPDGQIGQQSQDRVHPGWIQVGRGFVEDEQPRSRSQHAGHGQALLLATGERHGEAAVEACQAHLGQGFGYPLRHDRPGPAAILQPKGNLVVDAAHDDLAVRVLEDKAHALAQETCRGCGNLERSDPQAAPPLAGQNVRHQPGNGPGQRALARSRRAQHQ